MEETGWHYLVSLVLYAQQLPSHPLQNKVCDLANWQVFRRTIFLSQSMKISPIERNLCSLDITETIIFQQISSWKFGVVQLYQSSVVHIMLQALAAWEYVGSVLSEMEERGDGGLQLEESAFQLLFAAVGLELLRDPQSATETVEVGRL